MISWQIGTLIVLALALGGGMLWYERSRPPSQIVALVAVLAALAVAGRIVLAPIPNVVATTDIVFFSGFALGPAPGFAVGALGGLVSNFWLGQGVWTPWQMVGWGMTGVAGGVLWRMTRGRANRFILALACGAAGLVFGAWMNFQTMVAFGGEISLDRYLALQVRAIPFDLAHISGNVIFALAAGPAMVAALRRFRERFEWRQATSVAGAFLIAFSMIAIVAAPPAEAAPSSQVTKAAGWLKSQQNDDGGFGASPGAESSVNITARAMFGLAAAEINPLDVVKNGKTPLDYLNSRRKNLKEASDIALVILALRTVDGNPKSFNGRNLVKALEARKGNHSSYGGKVNVAAFAALAFKSAKADGARQGVVKWLRSVQNVDTNGGWGIGEGVRSDPDSTGTTLMAVGGTKTIRRAMSFLRSTQKSSGGWASGSTVNSQSTSVVVQGSVAAGKGPSFLKENGNSGPDFLLERQHADGSIWYSKSSDQTRVWVTADALPAMAGKHLPISAPPREKKEEPKAPPSNNETNTTVPPPNLFGSGGSGGSSLPNNFGSSSSSGNGSKIKPPPSLSPGTDPSDVPDAPLLPPSNVPMTPVAPTEAVLAASQEGPRPSPLAAILICLIVSGGLGGGTYFLVRKYRW